MGGQAVLTINHLPDEALGAASAFHAAWVARVQAEVAGGAEAVVMIMPPAPVDHSDWRRTAARDLARALAPARVNILSGADQTAIAETLAYLGNAPGVTGHYLSLHGN